MVEMITVPAELLRRQIASVYEAWGMAKEHIDTTVHVMVETDLMGIDSHGVGMLSSYQEKKDHGRLNPRPEIRIVKETPATALIDAGRSIGHVPAVMAMKLAIRKAKAIGVGAVGVRNSNHYGAAGYYSTLASAEGIIGMAFTSVTSAIVVPTFSREPYLGTNPIAFAAPAKKNKPLSLDMATSTVASGKVSIAKRTGKPMPVGWVVDKEGRPLTDASKAPSGNRRLTALGGTRELGSHKGYGLGLMVEVLCSTLNGQISGVRDTHDPDFRNKTRETVGHFFMAIDPEMFGGGEGFREEMDALMDRLRGLPPVDAAEPVQVAGDQQYKDYAERSKSGIPLTKALYEEVRAVCQASGAPFMLGD
jgi:LDH2 family malate/lactate/ureidoglycolate dehydrogenase